jgi:hypothetical protein
MIETMEYVEQGGLESVTVPRKEFRLDGLFVSRFDHPDKKRRQKKLASLYKDKHLMIEASIAFIVIFLNFMNDPNYYVKGISEKGVSPGSLNIIS